MQLTDKELLAALTSLILPLIIAAVQRPTWSDRRRAVVAFVCIFAWTFFGVLYVGDGVPQTVDWRAWIRLLMVNAVTTWTTYQMFYKPTGIAQQVEAMTTPGRSAAKLRLMQEATRRTTPPRTPDHPA